jgi:hypothetical protein
VQDHTSMLHIVTVTYRTGKPIIKDREAVENSDIN